MFSQSYSISLLRNVTMDVKEIQIPVPWGHVAATTMGKKEDPTVLVIHGIRDNSRAFSDLIKLLPKPFYYVVIDLPSHGQSSFYPMHRPIYLYDVLVTYKYIVDYLDSKKYILFTHSFATQAGILFAQIYPNYIKKIVALDSIGPYPISEEFAKQHITSNIQNLNRIILKITSGFKQPSYTYNECFQKLYEQRNHAGLTKDAAKNLLERWLIPVDKDRFKFSLDPRAKTYFNCVYSMKYLTKLLKYFPIKCPVLYIIANESVPTIDYYKLYLQDIQKQNNNCFVIRINGNHDVHTINPASIAPLIANFLLYTVSKL